MVSCCCLSNDRSLTKCLIENSNKSLKCFHRFVNKPEWADGLDIWSSTETFRKTRFDKNLIEFDYDLGLYLPRYDKTNSIDINSNKNSTNNSFPERRQQLFKKEKVLSKENNSNKSLSDENSSTSEETQVCNSTEKCNSIKINSRKVRFPLRQVLSKNSSEETKTKQIVHQTSHSINKDKLKSLLNEQLNHLFTRETNHIYNKRTLVRIPSVQIKHRNLSKPRTAPQTDQNILIERYTKIQHLFITTQPTQPTIHSKSDEGRSSPFIFQHLLNPSLTVTPLDFAPKALQNSSIDKTIQQDTRLSTSRSLNQTVSLSNSSQQNDEQFIKKNIETGFISPSGHFLVSNSNISSSSSEVQCQTLRKYVRHHRSASKTGIQRTKTLDLLPPVIAGKRIDIYISNQRHS